MRSSQLHQVVQEACHQKIKHSCYKHQARSPPSTLNRVSICRLYCRRSPCSHHAVCKACILPLLDNPWDFPFSAPGTPIHLHELIMYMLTSGSDFMLMRSMALSLRGRLM